MTTLALAFQSAGLTRRYTRTVAWPRRSRRVAGVRRDVSTGEPIATVTAIGRSRTRRSK